MKHVMLVAIAGTALAVSPAIRGEQLQAAPKPATQAERPAAPTAQKPAEAPKPETQAPAKRPARPTASADQAQGHTTPKDQPQTAPPGAVPTGELPLGSVRLPKALKADGKPLPAGSYQVRLTAQEATPNVAGQTEQLERWVEFVQGGQVKGREVVSIVPQTEIDKVQKDAPPGPNRAKVELLKGGDYYRVWINKAGNHYLIHLPPA